MPRIDPCTLLKTLGVLLSPEGGIRSADEVTRLAHLMHKFSKKLVSKCIYIQILQATTTELLSKFLDEEGWDLLNAWVSDAILDKNWPHCKELIKLFLVCPVSVSRMKDNQILKLMRQLTCDVKVDIEVGSFASQVVEKWMATPKQNNSKQIGHVALMDGGLNGKKGKSSLKSRNNAAIEDSETDAKSIDDKTKPVPLLNGLNKEVLVSVKKEKEIKGGHEKIDGKESKKGRNKEKVKDLKKLEKPKERKHHASERVKKETEKQSEKDGREKKSKPYSQTELRDDLGDVERNRIKIMAQKMKNDLISRKDSSFKGELNVSHSMTTGVRKIPKIPKIENKEKGVHGFNDLMGALDSTKAKKTVKVAPSKNKNKGLMESLSSTNISKQPPSKLKPIKKAARPSLESRAPTHKSIINGDNFIDLKSEKTTQSKIIAPANKSEKRPAEFDLPFTLKESNIFGDVLSTVMHDDIALIDDRPRKKKLRLSDIRNEKDAAELEKIKSEKEVGNKEILPSFSFYGGGEESRNNEMEIGSGQALDEGTYEDIILKQTSDSEVELKEATVSMPREVSGILVMVKGSTSTKKNISWESDQNLVRIEYFEMDETERINVNKVKFGTMREREAAMEKPRLISQVNNGLAEEEEDNCKDKITWRLIKMDSEPPLEDYGNDSNEKLVQTEREKTVLQALIFNNKKPPDLSEPDFCVIPEKVPIIVPLEDTSEGMENSLIDYSISGWPSGIDHYVPTSGSFLPITNFNSKGSAVQPEMKNGFMGYPKLTLDNDPLPAAETTRQEGFLASHLQFEGGINRHLNPINKGSEFQESGPMKPNIQTMQNFYGNGMENDNHFGPEPYFNRFNPQVGQPAPGFHNIENNPFQPEKDQGRNNWGRNRGTARGFGRGFPLSGLNNRGFGNMGGIAERGFGNERNGLKDGKTERRGKKPNIRGKKQETRPCKFWMENGNCKHEDRCRFKHPSR